MYACPSCDHRVQDFELKCPRCDGDLQVVAILNELPDVHFNHALRAAQSGNWMTATQLLGSVLSVRPNDADAWYLLGLVYARRGVLEMARDCWNMVLMLQPKEPRTMNALAKLAEVVQESKSEHPQG